MIICDLELQLATPTALKGIMIIMYAISIITWIILKKVVMPIKYIWLGYRNGMRNIILDKVTIGNSPLRVQQEVHLIGPCTVNI